jgi:hypothetical protein
MPLNPHGDLPDTGVPAHLAAEMTAEEQYEWHRSFLRRHRVSRRTVLAGSAATAALVAAGCSTSSSPSSSAGGSPSAEVTGRHVGFGPDASTQLRFTGQLTRKPDPGVQIFLDHGPTRQLGGTVTAEIRNLLAQVPQSDGGILAAEQYYVHAPVDGLAAAAPHYYRWRTSDGFTGPVVSVSTAMGPQRATAKPFTFTMVGDQGTDSTPEQPADLPSGAYDDRYYKSDNDPTVPHAANIVSQIVKVNPAFHLVAGDIAYADPSGTGSKDQFVPGANSAKPAKGFDKFNPYVWDAYFQAIEPSASVSPWMFATGNHDIETIYGQHGYGGHAARLEMPGGGPGGCPSVYSFTYGNVAVLSLDANEVSYEIKANTGYSAGAQNSWVDATLGKYRSDPNIDFIVCFFHHCAYSTTAAHASDGGVRDAWAGLFDKHQVDVVLSGHNHVYERTDPLRGGQVGKPAPDNAVVYPATDGTIYYTVGSGGRPRYDFQPGEGVSYRGNALPDTSVPNSYVWLPDGTQQPEAVNWSRTRFDNYAFVRMDVRPGTLSSEMDVVAVDEHGNEFDKVTLRRQVAA